MLYEHKAMPAEYKAGLNLAIERGWLVLDESGTRACQGADPRKATNINVDLLNKSANLVAIDQIPPAPGQAPNMVQVNFHFDPPPAEGLEKDKAIAAAKAILLRAANEI
jgi:hypothetical protein